MLIELAAEAGFRKTAGSPPTLYELPLTVTVDRWKAGLRAVGLGGIGAIAMAPGWITLSGGVCPPSGAGETFAFLIFAPLVVCGGILLGLYSLASSAVLFRQAFLGTPALIIDSNGVRELRSHWSAPWETISRLHPAQTDFGGLTIRLRLREPCDPDGAEMLRTSTLLTQLFRRRADERFMSIESLSIPAHRLLCIMSIIVKNYGGETDPSLGYQDRIVTPA